MAKSFQVLTRALKVASVALALFIFLRADCSAQSQMKTGVEGEGARQQQQQTLPATARALYEEAENYTRVRFGEFARTGVPYNQGLEQKIFQERRELAARNAARLDARGPLHGPDLYYAGLLYTLADKTDASLDALRRFLAEDAGAELKQSARFVFVQQATATGRAAEAEKVLAEYMSGEPRAPDEVNKLQLALASFYVKSREYARAAEHARVSFELALRGVGDKSSEPRARDGKIYTAGALLSDSLLKAGRRAEALAVIQQMRSLALALPSARLYGGATDLLLAKGEPLNVPPSSVAGASGNGAADVMRPPDIRISEWVEQTPFKLADMRGRVVLLDFWATWCGPCRASMPKLNALYKKYQDRGFVVLGLTNYFGNAEGRELTPAEEIEYLRQFKKKNNIAYGFGVADHIENETSYGIQAIPTAFLIDRAGRVRFITTDASDTEATALAEMVRKLVEEQYGNDK